MSKQLLELVEMCEKVAHASRQLDGDIALAIGWDGPSAHGQRWSQTYPGCRERWQDDNEPFNNWKVPRYTSSLDAAMTLVPEGWGFKADCCLGYGNTFTVGHVGENKMYDRPQGWAKSATPALALCAAALCARAATLPPSERNADENTGGGQ